MTNIYEPLDFELEPIPTTTVPLHKKKKKLIGLDDLLVDYEKEQKKIRERQSRKRKVWKTFDSDDEDDDNDAVEAQLSVCVDQCQNEINQINGDDVMPSWGIQVFRDQRRLPQQECAELKDCNLLQPFMKNKINSLVGLDNEKGEDFLEGLLTNGWLYKIVRRKRVLEKSIAIWTFNLMLYSSKMGLTEAACEFWCKILLLKDDSSGFQIDWLPRYSDLKRALDIYGFFLDEPSRISSDVDMTRADSDVIGSLQNITSWIKCTTACCKARSKHRIFSTGEAEEVLVIIFFLSLDRKLLGLSMLLSECLASVISFFSNDEWQKSCHKAANSLACRLPGDMNCLRLVDSVIWVDGRSKQLRSGLSFWLLMKCLDEKECDAEEVLRSLCSINVKDKNCDLVKCYICLSLAESWLSFDPALKVDAVVRRLWSGYLKKCCGAITITDFRSYASNVRSKASYLLHGTRG